MPTHGKNRLAFLSAIFLLIAPFTQAKGESITGERLQKLTAQISTQFPDNPSEKPSLAILPLNAPPSLTRRNIGVAMAEILTHTFFDQSKFRLVERIEIDQLLREQKFQLTGAVDSKTAVNVGKITGAEYILIGSVDKIGNQYQVNARLVKVESSQVIASEFIEVPASEFDEEAKSYINLVPDRQKIGIFGIFTTSFKSKSINTFSVEGEGTPANSASHQVTPKPLTWNMGGLGIRYFPQARFFIEGAFLTGMPDSDTIAMVQQIRMPSNELVRSASLNFSSQSAYRIAAGFSGNINRRFTYRSAIGLQKYNLKAEYTMPPAIGLYAIGADDQYKHTAKLTKINPILLLGFNIALQERIQLSLNAGYDFGDTSMRLEKAGDPTVLEIQRYSLEPMLSINF